MVLAMMVVGSVIVVALLNFAVTLFRTQPRLAERDDTFLSARSAMEMAIVFQRDSGPGGCYTDVQPATFEINGHTATVSCSPAGNYYGTARNQLGIITTGMDPATALTGPAKGQVQGAVFVAGADPANPTPWYALVGEDPEGDGSHRYPSLPPVPTFVRGTHRSAAARRLPAVLSWPICSSQSSSDRATTTSPPASTCSKKWSRFKLAPGWWRARVRSPDARAVMPLPPGISSAPK